MSLADLKNKYQSPIHFIGIGGIGMSAIASILSKVGCQVQGSDQKHNNNMDKLEAQGIKCFTGHNYQNINNEIGLVVKTSVIKDNNPEILAAKEKNITIIRRSDMLAILMKEKLGITVAGTHGKTSTTAMAAVMLECAELDPTVIDGGIINYYGSNAKFGQGKFLVAESDESDGSFIDLPTYIGIITNIEPEHLEFYNGSFDRVKSYYRKYITQIPAEGLAILCTDDTEVRKIYDELKEQYNIVSCGLNEPADITASNISYDIEGLKFNIHSKKSGLTIEGLRIPTYGIHNVKNALAIIALAEFLGFSETEIRKGFSNFSGVKRRFTKTGQVNNITIIDDYGHHPSEIKATLKVARTLAGNNKVITVFQPHKYTRTRDLFREFCQSFFDSDIVIIADIYSAGESPIENITQDTLIQGLQKAGHKKIIKLNDKQDLARLVKEQAQSGDIVLCIGAGNITDWAAELPNLLTALYEQN